MKGLREGERWWSINMEGEKAGELRGGEAKQGTRMGMRMRMRMRLRMRMGDAPDRQGVGGRCTAQL